MTGIFRYIRHEDVAEWEKVGWRVVAGLYPPHSDFSVLMKWFGDQDNSEKTTCRPGYLSRLSL